MAENYFHLVLKMDNWFARLVHRYFSHPYWNYSLSRINRGEVLAILILPFLYYNKTFVPFLLHFCYLLIFTYATDRFVLLIKKWVSRKRPLLDVLGKIDSNPDMKHSFPSAHSANSSIVILLMVFGYQESFIWLVVPLLAGVGRLITLHHYLSDVVGGWILGISFGVLAVVTKPTMELLFLDAILNWNS